MRIDREKNNLLNNVHKAAWKAHSDHETPADLVAAERNLTGKVIEAAKAGASAHELDEAIFAPRVISASEKLLSSRRS